CIRSVIHAIFAVLFLILRRPACPPLFPYTTLFRSCSGGCRATGRGRSRGGWGGRRMSGAGRGRRVSIRELLRRALLDHRNGRGGRCMTGAPFVSTGSTGLDQLDPLPHLDTPARCARG